MAIFPIDEGSLDDTYLSGVSFALYNHFPANITAGNWRVGVVIDDGVSDAQAQAIERIMSGNEGGPLAEFTPLIGEFIGLERGKVSLSNGSGSVEGKTEFTFEALKGPDGQPTMVHDAMFGFAKDYMIGKSTSKSEAFGLSFAGNGNYGESANFEFSTEMHGEVHPRA